MLSVRTYKVVVRRSIQVVVGGGGSSSIGGGSDVGIGGVVDGCGVGSSNSRIFIITER